MASRSSRTGAGATEKQRDAKADASPTSADDMPQWAKDMMAEIKKGNVEILKYREETKAEIARCKEQIAKGGRESKAEMEKWARSLEESTRAQFESLYGEVRLAGEKASNLATKMDEREKEVDETLNGQSDAIAGMEGRLKEMEKEMLRLKGRSEDLEARSRRNNIQRCGEHTDSRGRRDGEGVPPRAFVRRCHYFAEKEEILKKAREMERTPEGRRGTIHIYPDYTQEVNRKRAAFKEARSLLRTRKEVRYGMRYPATLVITPEGLQTRLFENPKDAVEYIRKELNPGEILRTCLSHWLVS
ncbi:hypothetical protein AAFF_G00409510 [Aldrovandia affinis]|uniref:Uncharacterized protein n=1 Tax=Aldrovandia affinis TaxID=143900 RepID=A0AAD7WK16_9TELE|nr:hypothetical protein AAFF_G00409510 [Aldrovandia affinis]